MNVTMYVTRNRQPSARAIHPTFLYWILLTGDQNPVQKVAGEGRVWA